MIQLQLSIGSTHTLFVPVEFLAVQSLIHPWRIVQIKTRSEDSSYNSINPTFGPVLILGVIRFRARSFRSWITLEDRSSLAYHLHVNPQ